MTNFTITLRTLTPLHIGAGQELRQGFDFAVYQGRTYRLNEDALLEAKADRLRPDPSGRLPLPATLLDPADFDNPALFRYVLPGAPRSGKADARLKAATKDVHDRAYIPGSSLKGALRTALAVAAWPEVKPRLDRAALKPSRSWAGQGLERRLFGPDPNHDLLRALQVSDLTGPQKPGAGMAVVNAQVLSHAPSRGGGQIQTPIELECVRSEVVFHGTLRVEDYLFSSSAQALGFANRRRWLDELLKRVRTRSQRRVEVLAEQFDTLPGCEIITNFYTRLSEAQLSPNQALLQLGWGTGWDGMTFGSLLQEADPAFFAQIVRDYRMSKGPYHPGQPFPKSRRAAMLLKDGVTRPGAPFGWVLLEVDKI